MIPRPASLVLLASFGRSFGGFGVSRPDGILIEQALLLWVGGGVILVNIRSLPSCLRISISRYGGGNTAHARG